MARTRHTMAAVACLWAAILVGGVTTHAQTTQPSPEPAQTSNPIVVIARHGQSLRGKVDSFPILLLRGTQEQRGEAHGFLAAKEIIGVCDATAGFLKQGSYAAGKPANPWEQGIEAVARFTFPPRFEAELRGMLRGIEMALPNEQDRQVPALGRAITLEDLKLLQAGEVFELMRCSQFSAWGPLTGDGQPIVGRNWDYPPLYSMDYACVLAIEPAEKELSPTLDAVCFGMIGSGLATINHDGVYAAANDGGISEKGVIVDQPMPAGLLLREVMETSPRDKVVEDFAEALKNHCVLGLLFHMVVPDSGGRRGPSTIVEYHPRDGGQINLRRTEPKLPTALVMTN
ncbi:MAG: hypothetical protein IT442_11875, partial [Phycisphaeraceae bacterium]|nr:hypothetical protein [Phycisphaeraceae bacterium]